MFSMRIFPGRDEGKDPLFCQMQSVRAAASIDGYGLAACAWLLELFGRAGRILKAAVDKKEAFTPFFVYFQVRASLILRVR